MLDQRSQTRVAALTPFQQVTAQLKEALRENVALKAQIATLTAAASAKAAPKSRAVKAPKAAKAPSGYPDEFLAAYDAGRKWRSGSTPKAAFMAWRARITAGADHAAITAGAAAYNRHCEATGREKMMAQTFFGPGEHYTADWTVPAAPARGGKFDPVAHVNQSAMPSQGAWFDGIIDITPR